MNSYGHHYLSRHFHDKWIGVEFHKGSVKGDGPTCKVSWEADDHQHMNNCVN